MPAIAERRSARSEAVVPGLPLPSVLAPDVICRAKLIKIDVEGAEWEVLRGFEQLLPALSHETEMVLEVDPQALDAQGVEAAELLDLLDFAGFEPYIAENDYSLEFYLAKKHQRPRLLEVSLNRSEPIFRETTDLVLRRRGSKLRSGTPP